MSEINTINKLQGLKLAASAVEDMRNFCAREFVRSCQAKGFTPKDTILYACDKDVGQEDLFRIGRILWNGQCTEAMIRQCLEIDAPDDK